MTDRASGASRPSRAGPGDVSIGPDKDPARIAAMFDAIAARYDLLNHLLSAGLDRQWRARAVAALKLSGGETVLDLCTGTADLAIAAVGRQNGQAGCVIGIDFAARMLHLGQAKLRQARVTCVQLVRADAVSIPLAAGSIDAVTIGFGIRNVSDPAAVCAEMFRVLRPGGQLVILEFGVPHGRGLRAIYLWYFRRVLPWIGRLISRHREAYAYLPASVSAFSSPEAFSGLLDDAGFSHVHAAPLTFGIVYLYVAVKDCSRLLAQPGLRAAFNLV